MDPFPTRGVLLVWMRALTRWDAWMLGVGLFSPAATEHSGQFSVVASAGVTVGLVGELPVRGNTRAVSPNSMLMLVTCPVAVVVVTRPNFSVPSTFPV